MKIAYLVLAHKNADQVLRLYVQLKHPDAVFIFHFDRTCTLAFYRQMVDTLKDEPHCHFARRMHVNWGSFGMVQASLNCLQKLQEIGVEYDRVMLISGQDFPLRTHAEMTAFLQNHSGKNFVEFTHYDQMTPDEQARYDRIHFWPTDHRHIVHPSDSKFALFRFAHKVIVGLLPGKTQKPEEIELYKGSFWWVLEKEAVDTILAQLQTSAGQRLKAFFRYVNHSSEGYYQTVLMNSPLKDTLINEDLRFVKWKFSEGHPDPLLMEDFEPMMTSGKFFARKFDMDTDAALMEKIEQRLTE